MNFDWGIASPDPTLPSDHFSVHWSGKVEPKYSETYTFYTVSDDGVRLWVNGQLLIDNWSDHGPTENAAIIQLSAGQKYDIAVEYYENGGGATMQLLWSSASQPKQAIPSSQLYPSTIPATVPESTSPEATGTGLRGTYFNGMSLSSIAFTRTDATVNFDWGVGSPDPSLTSDHFSVHWSGKVEPKYSESYSFFTVSDDGVRLWVNGQLLVDNWSDHGPGSRIRH